MSQNDLVLSHSASPETLILHDPDAAKAPEADLEGEAEQRRPISIGHDDEFILLPAFNPDFDEIFTSLTK